ncbi:uncharacterized protein PHALS_10002 [Plasmopara halstedii]|uniref:Uncharacterized protein n=1 Tax=Plasmopara halstedii TaxID=4781 RepID=A0A0P1AH17_PLAHL|nr:uncharacterized protein PHALS_10002 [Plasmopara halstedii]CEG39766.1 hypothetical protein PHALS_10002 [Plasmopara halstedii]|eukprot:XP_024576135.1 hypothetical protein PHALS_10002 [Plasmopara halstedii]
MITTTRVDRRSHPVVANPTRDDSQVLTLPEDLSSLSKVRSLKPTTLTLTLAILNVNLTTEAEQPAVGDSSEERRIYRVYVD